MKRKQKQIPQSDKEKYLITLMLDYAMLRKEGGVFLYNEKEQPVYIINHHNGKLFTDAMGNAHSTVRLLNFRIIDEDYLDTEINEYERLIREQQTKNDDELLLQVMRICKGSYPYITCTYEENDDVYILNIVDYKIDPLTGETDFIDSTGRHYNNLHITNGELIKNMLEAMKK